MDKRDVIYFVVDQFMAGFSPAEIATAMSRKDKAVSTLDVMHVLQSEAAQEYKAKIVEIRRMELDALSDGPALEAMREGLRADMKSRLDAADKIWKASGKYSHESSVVVTLTDILKKVMEERGEKEK